MIFDRNDVAVAASIDLPNGKRIWCPPTGRPYWVGGANAGPHLTDEELDEHGLSAKKSCPFSEVWAESVRLSKQRRNI